MTTVFNSLSIIENILLKTLSIQIASLALYLFLKRKNNKLRKETK